MPFLFGYWFSRPVVANTGQTYCRMLQAEHSAEEEHSAILYTCIKLHLPLRSLFCLFFNGCLRQVLLYRLNYAISI